MALLGTYVGVIPVALGMLFLPFIGRAPKDWVRVFMAFTIGLLGFLAVDGSLEGFEIGGESGGAFGGVELLFLGAAVAYLDPGRDRAHGCPAVASTRAPAAPAATASA